ncbi:MAG: ABC transporter substrate-binding protein [Mycobacterium leprae]
MKRYLVAATATLMAASVLAGCGAAKTQAPATTSGSADQSKPVTITYARVKDPTNATKQLLDEFQKKYPNIKVNYLEMPAASDQTHDQFVTKLSAGDTSVDIMTLDVTWPGEFGAANWVLPLDQYFTKDELAKYLPGTLGTGTYNGKQYAIPFWSDAGFLYYRKDILQKYNLPVPKTWDDIVKDSKAVVGKDGIESGIVFQADQYEGLVCDTLEYMRGNGGDVLDAQGNVNFNSPNNVAAIKFMRSLITDKVAPAGVTTYKEADSLRPWLDGKALFMRNWAYAWASSQTDPSTKVKDLVGIVPMPIGPNGSKPSATLGGWDLAINGNIPKDRIQAAITFVKWMAGPDGEKIDSIVGGKLPTLADTYKDADVLKAAPHYTDLYNVFINAQPRPVNPNYPKISDAMQINLHKALTGEISAEDAAKNIQDSLTKLLKK